MFYLDASVFASAVVNEGVVGDDARIVLDKAARRESQFFTSYLTVDEVGWVVEKFGGKALSISVCRNLIELPIAFVEVDRDVIQTSLKMAEDYSLKPRDAIHAASAKLNGLGKIISEDSDFDKVEWLQRISIAEAVKL